MGENEKLRNTRVFIGNSFPPSRNGKSVPLQFKNESMDFGSARALVGRLERGGADSDSKGNIRKLAERREWNSIRHLFFNGSGMREAVLEELGEQAREGRLEKKEMLGLVAKYSGDKEAALAAVAKLGVMGRNGCAVLGELEWVARSPALDEAAVAAIEIISFIYTGSAVPAFLGIAKESAREKVRGYLLKASADGSDWKMQRETFLKE